MAAHNFLLCAPATFLYTPSRYSVVGGYLCIRIKVLASFVRLELKWGNWMSDVLNSKSVLPSMVTAPQDAELPAPMIWTPSAVPFVDDTSVAPSVMVMVPQEPPFPLPMPAAFSPPTAVTVPPLITILPTAAFALPMPAAFAPPCAPMEPPLTTMLPAAMPLPIPHPLFSPVATRRREGRW